MIILGPRAFMFSDHLQPSLNLNSKSEQDWMLRPWRKQTIKWALDCEDGDGRQGE